MGKSCRRLRVWLRGGCAPERSQEGQQSLRRSQTTAVRDGGRDRPQDCHTNTASPQSPTWLANRGSSRRRSAMDPEAGAGWNQPLLRRNQRNTSQQNLGPSLATGDPVAFRGRASPFATPHLQPNVQTGKGCVSSTTRISGRAPARQFVETRPHASRRAMIAESKETRVLRAILRELAVTDTSNQSSERRLQRWNGSSITRTLRLSRLRL